MEQIKEVRKIKDLKKAELVKVLTEIKENYEGGLQFDEDEPEGWLGDDDLFGFVEYMQKVMRTLEI